MSYGIPEHSEGQMANHALAKGARLRDLANEAQRVATDLAELAGQADLPSRTVERVDRMIAAGERLASDLNDVAGSVRRVFRG